ncbi:MAG: hypothetical protein II557_07225, partial [Clostridia bacterium]|nr:hypothetical protein [Clostridia bacterium]
RKRSRAGKRIGEAVNRSCFAHHVETERKIIKSLNKVFDFLPLMRYDEEWNDSHFFIISISKYFHPFAI